MPISPEELTSGGVPRLKLKARAPRQEIIDNNPIVEFLRVRGYELFQTGENFATGSCPAGQHKKPGHRPVSIDVTKGVWYCNDHKVGGSVIDWQAIEKGMTAGEAMQSLNGEQPERQRQFVCAYDYTDEAGKLLFQSVRYKVPPPKNKTFLQRQPGANGGWAWGTKGVRRVLYHLPQILAAETVVVVEGEKDANALTALGFVATTNVGGAGKWRDEYAQVFKGKHVVVFGDIGDPDKNGENHTQTVLRSLAGKTKSLRHAIQPAHDVSDWIDTLHRLYPGEEREVIDELIRETKEFEAPANVEVLQSPPLPQIEDAATLILRPIKVPPPVIESVAHRGEKISIGGASKAFKTWILSDLAISVATGTAWLGYFPTRRGRVLHLNFELLGDYFTQRLRELTEENQVTLEEGYLHLWNLRGYACDLTMLLPGILQRIRTVEYSLINLDPIYKLLGRKSDENSAGNIADLLNQVEQMAVRTGAAVCFGAHYSKGNQSQKYAIDRVSGSGVFARDPDSLINFTEHKEDNCFSVEVVMRHHPPVKPLVVRWDYPVFRVDHDLSPFDLKEPGRPEKHSKDDLLELIDEPMSATDIIALAAQELQISRRRVFEMLVELKKEGRMKQPEKRGKYERI